MTRRVHPLALVTAVVAMGAGCGGDPLELSDGDATSPSIDVDDSVPGNSVALPPRLGELSVADGCAEVRLANGGVWAESCLVPTAAPRVAMWESIDGVEVALLRFAEEVELVSAQPDSVAFVQTDGWALIESPTPDFTMTFGSGGDEAVCSYNPFFIDCDVKSARSGDT